MWTAFPGLDEVLAALVEGLRAALGDNLVGVYLQGSFALGSADEWSDADFLVVTGVPVGEAERRRLDALHRRLFALPGHWPKHLEGSYINRDLLRRPDTSRTELLFLDHGSQELAWDDHCNTAYVRWTLREHGITLLGPEPATLVEPLAADVLREESRARLQEWADWALSISSMNRWQQPYIVISLCRVLWTIEHGTVASKQAAGEWALGVLDSEWSALIQRALEDRPDPVDRWYLAAEPADVERTRGFVRYVSRSRS
ncbi:MAG TPA: aminoglycoside adenylyltransferase domain-containing protein [Gaiellaceae bacterium]